MAARRKTKAEAKPKKRRLTLDCDICGEPVELSPARYVELVRAGERPRCRKNGCERLCGRKKAGTSRSGQVLATQEVPLLAVHWPQEKKGRKNGALAKLAVSRDEAWRYEGCRENG